MTPMSAQSRVSIIALTYNSARHLPALLGSIAKQTYPNIELIVVDNASTDNTVQWLRTQTIRTVDQLIANPTNVWFTRGNNQGIAAAMGEWIYVCNDDIVLDDQCIERLVQRGNSNEQIGLVGGKMLKLIDGQPSTILDSAGIILKRSGQAINRGEQEADSGQYNQAETLFGITGAGMLLRRTALEDVRHRHEPNSLGYFDDDFVAYKEDVDLSWRLHRAGWQVWYEPTALIYHARSIQHTTLEGRQEKSALIRAMSYRNHLWMLMKNLTLGQFVRRLPWLAAYECAKLGYALVREWSTVRIIPQTLAGLPRMLRKRHDHA